MRHHLDEMEPRYCAAGVRRWAARMGLDWQAFLRDGIEIEQVEATGDAMALKLAEHVRKQHGDR
jgi:hypothetical protein